MAERSPGESVVAIITAVRHDDFAALADLVGGLDAEGRAQALCLMAGHMNAMLDLLIDYGQTDEERIAMWLQHMGIDAMENAP